MRASAISLAPVSHTIDFHQEIVIIDFVEHSVFANPSPPLMLKTNQSLNTTVAGISF